MLCKYALNSVGKLVFVDDVENGVKCNCTCPSCGEKMVAKNNGEIKDHHFAHSSGSDCDGYKETLLHIWSKQIIEDSKMLMIPNYKNLPWKKLNFKHIQIEQTDKLTNLKPDIIGISDDGLELWIEIFVTHKCNEDKKRLINENSINCIEIKIPKEIEEKEQLKKFLIYSIDCNFKHFLNYPYGDALMQEKNNLKKQEEYNRVNSAKITQNKKSERERISDKFPFRNQKEVDYFIKYGDYKKIDETQDSYKYFGKPRSQWSNDELKWYQKNVGKWTDDEIKQYQKNVFGIIDYEIDNEKQIKIDIDSLIGENLNFEFD